MAPLPVGPLAACPPSSRAWPRLLHEQLLFVGLILPLLELVAATEHAIILLAMRALSVGMLIFPSRVKRGAPLRLKQKQLKAAKPPKEPRAKRGPGAGVSDKYTPFLSLSLVMAHFTDLRAVLPRKRWGSMVWRMAEIRRRMATKSPPELSHWYEVHHTRVTCHVGVVRVFSD